MKLLSIIAAMLMTSAALAQNGDPYKAAATWKWGQSEANLSAIEAEVRKATPAQYPAIEAKLIEIVSSADATPEAKGFACRQLRVVGSAKCIPAVAKLLTDENARTWRGMRWSRILDPAAGAALRDAMSGAQGKVLAGVISSIGRRRDAQAIEALKKLAGAEEEMIASAAMGALGEIGTREAYAAITSGNKSTEALKRSQFSAMLACAAHMAADGNAKEAASIYESLMGSADYPKAVRIGALRGRINTSDAQMAVKLIGEQLQGEDAAMSAAALSAFSGASAEIRNAVVAQLPSMNARGQIALIRSLADQPEVPARAGLMKLFTRESDSSTEVRLEALAALAVHGEADDVRFLVQLASGTGPEAAAAMQTLQRMGKAGVDEALVDLIASKDAKARAVVTAALGARRVESALPKLVQLLAGNDLEVAVEAAKALGLIGTTNQLPDLCKVLLSTSDAAMRTAAEDAAKAICLRTADKAACANTLLNSLKDAKTATAKVSLLKLLPFTRQAQALVAVRVATEDSNQEVAEAATRTLFDWPDITAAPFILDIANKTTNQTHAVLALQARCVWRGSRTSRWRRD